MNAADRLRQAAQKIRETADGLPSEWWYDAAEYNGWTGDAAAHIALWSPPVAVLVAEWLEDIAADKDSGLGSIHPRAIDVADLILGGNQ